jgi:hypothetical protein
VTLFVPFAIVAVPPYSERLPEADATMQRLSRPMITFCEVDELNSAPVPNRQRLFPETSAAPLKVDWMATL